MKCECEILQKALAEAEKERNFFRNKFIEKKRYDLKWRNIGTQLPNDGECVLVIDPENGIVKMAIFKEESFLNVESSLSLNNVKRWMRLDNIPVPRY